MIIMTINILSFIPEPIICKSCHYYIKFKFQLTTYENNFFETFRVRVNYENI